MTLDVQSLLVVMMINMVALSLAFPAIMGWQVSPAARWAQGALLVQTLGWICLVFSRQSPTLDPLLSAASMVGLCCGMAMLWQSRQGWLGARHAPAVFALGGGHSGAHQGYGPALIDDNTPTPAHARFSRSHLAQVLAAGLALWLAAMAAPFPPAIAPSTSRFRRR